MTARRSVLFVHQNFPGQFPAIAAALLARGDRVAAIASQQAPGMAGVDVRRWSLERGTTPAVFAHAVRAEADLLRAETAMRTALQMRADGFVPDVIVGNPAWGETLHMKEVWPSARLILLGEYWYTAHGGDVDFDPEFQASNLGVTEAAAVNARNAGHALAYVLADRIVCPTAFQATTFPPSLRERLVVHHEGIDTDRARRLIDAHVILPGGVTIDGTVPLVTFINRTLEPLRGFHSFMRALPALLDAHRTVQVAIVGAEATNGYGLAAPDGLTWKAWILREVGHRIDFARVHFLGRVPHATMTALLSVSRAHVYLTYPFVLSWSLLEAMACECLIVGSDTAPVREAIMPGKNGLLVDFFDTEQLAATIAMALRPSAMFDMLRAAARSTVIERYDQARTGVPGWLRLIDTVE